MPELLTLLKVLSQGLVELTARFVGDADFRRLVGKVERLPVHGDVRRIPCAGTGAGFSCGDVGGVGFSETTELSQRRVILRTPCNRRRPHAFPKVLR